MTKRFFTLLFAFAAMVTTAKAQVIVNETTFPDDAFREIVESYYSDLIYVNDDIYYYQLREGITQLYISHRQIKSLKGIEYFTELEELSLESNDQLTSLDVSNNRTLKYLHFHYNDQLTSINASQCTALESLWFGSIHKNLTSLDVSDCTALTSLFCDGNRNDYGKLTSLNASGCTALDWLKCDYNQLISLNVSGCTALRQLECGDNQLTSLDVSGLNELLHLLCYNNQLTSLDVSQSWVRYLYCQNNKLTSLTTNGLLSFLYCANNQLTSLHLPHSLQALSCHSNQIKGEAMDALVASLRTLSESVSGRYFYVIDTKNENEGNVCTKSQVSIAKAKGWTVYDYNGGGTFNEETRYYEFPEYEGSEDEILLDEENFPDDNFRAALAKDLGIAEGDKINTGLIVATTKIDVSNGKITMLSGIEYFTALTTIYCQSNMISGNAIKGLIAALPDLSSNGAKGMMRAEETNPRAGALYVLDFTDENEQNVCTAEHVAAANAKGWTVYCKTANGWQEYNGEVPTGIDGLTPNPSPKGKGSYYSIDGRKLNGEPTKKGIYIRNGKKVVK